MKNKYTVALDTRHKKEPKVSIIIPCFQAEKEIRRLVETISAQKGNIAYEAIFCDDGSTDNTATTLIKEIKRAAVQALVLARKTNGGVSHARNHCLEESKGELVCFLDHDDTWHNNKLIETVSAHEKSPKPILSFHSEYAVTEEGEEELLTYVKEEYLKSNDPHLHLFRTNFISTSTACLPGAIARSISFNPKYRNTQDYDYWLRASFEIDLHFIDKILGNYHIRPGSLSDDSTALIEQHRKIIFSNLPRAIKRYGLKIIPGALGNIIETYIKKESRP